MAAEDLTDLIGELRAAGGDTAAVEVKSAGGGLVILGVDERAGFGPVSLAGPRAL
jgi:hypothetical protein